MKAIKISATYWNECTRIEQNFISTYAKDEGVQACKSVLNLAKKATKETILSISLRKDIISIGSVYSVVYNDFKLTVQLSSGWIGDTHKVYKVDSNNNLIQVI